MSGIRFSGRDGDCHRTVTRYATPFLLSATDAEEIPQFTGLNKTIKLNFLNPEEQLTQRLHLYKVLSPEKMTNLKPYINYFVPWEANRHWFSVITVKVWKG